LMRISSSQL